MKPEQQILNSILEYLAVKKIWRMRLNTGAGMFANATGKARFVRFNKPGTADILASVARHESDQDTWQGWFPQPVWFEVKAPKGVQSQAQFDFQHEVEAEGHKYFVVRSIEDVEEALKTL